jgi:hypothetical protein
MWSNSVTVVQRKEEKFSNLIKEESGEYKYLKIFSKHLN